MNDFYSQMFNPNYVNPTYYFQMQQQIAQYQQTQVQEVYNVVKAVHDMCETVKELDSQHQEQALMLSLAEFARELGWNNGK